MTAFLGYDVLEIQPNRISAKAKVSRLANTLDNRSGRRTVDDRQNVPTRQMSFSWFNRSRAEVAVLTAFVAARKGRAVPFWVPTWQDDLVLAANAAIGATALYVEDCDYIAHQYSHLPRKFLGLVSYDGTIQPRYVSGAGVTTPGQEDLTIHSALTAALTVGQCLISFLMLSRLKNDEVKITWHSASVATCTMDFVELPSEYEAPS